MRIVCSGASGFIGRHLVYHLHNEGHDIVAVDLRPWISDGMWWPTSTVADIRSAADMARVMSTNPEAVIHLAAISGIGAAGPADTFETNVVGSLRVAEAAGCRLICASSCAAFVPSSSAYAASKAAMEMALPEDTHLRFSNVYGVQERGREKGVVQALLRACRDGGVFQVHGDGTQMRSYIHVDDICRAICHCLTKSVGVRTVSATINSSVLDLIEAARCAGWGSPTIEHIDAPANRTRSSTDGAGLMDLPCWLPQVDLVDGLRSLW